MSQPSLRFCQACYAAPCRCDEDAREERAELYRTGLALAVMGAVTLGLTYALVAAQAAMAVSGG